MSAAASAREAKRDTHQAATVIVAYDLNQGT